MQDEMVNMERKNSYYFLLTERTDGRCSPLRFQMLITFIASVSCTRTFGEKQEIIWPGSTYGH